MPEGRQSPPPERQTGAQLNDVPGSGKGTDQSASKDEVKDSLNVSLPSVYGTLLEVFNLADNEDAEPRVESQGDDERRLEGQVCQVSELSAYPSRCNELRGRV